MKYDVFLIGALGALLAFILISPTVAQIAGYVTLAFCLGAIGWSAVIFLHAFFTAVRSAMKADRNEGIVP